MEILRIGDKLISPDRIKEQIDRIITLRVEGASQQETAKLLGIDRSFVSKLEGLGEVSKGATIALLGFPVGNKEEIEAMALKYGVDYQLLLSEQERQCFVQDKSGAKLLEEIMKIVAQIHNFDNIIVAASDMRIHMIEALLNKKVLGIKIGESPLAEDKVLDTQVLEEILQRLRINK